jgi:hypothetical protein
MKKLSLIIAAIALAANVQAQVFNTGQTLKQGVFSLGVEPAVLINGGEDFMLFTHAGYGVKTGIDIGVKYGFGNPDYFGADLEFAMGQRVSLSVGAHNFSNFGLDGTLNFVIPIKSDLRLYGGFDTDMNFVKTTNNEGEETTELRGLYWVPVGLEVGLTNTMSLLFESEIGLNDNAYHLIGGGLSFYL